MRQENEIFYKAGNGVIGVNRMVRDWVYSAR